MANEPLPIDQLLAILEETPRLIARRTAGLEPEQLRAAPEPKAWSLNEVLAHLRACSDVWGGNIARILAEDKPAYRIVSPRSYIRRTDYPALEFQPSFEAFVAQREGLLAVLKPLPPTSWSRAAAVTTAKQVRERSVHSYAEQLARHEHSHHLQIESIVTSLHDTRNATASLGR